MPEIMVPLVGSVMELHLVRDEADAILAEVAAERGRRPGHPDRHHDRAAARGADLLPGRRGRRVLLLRHQRPDPDHLGLLAATTSRPRSSPPTSTRASSPSPRSRASTSTASAGWSTSPPARGATPVPTSRPASAASTAATPSPSTSSTAPGSTTSPAPRSASPSPASKPAAPSSGTPDPHTSDDDDIQRG